MTQRARLVRPQRLRLTKQFLAIRRHGRWAHGQALSLGLVPNDLPITRLGLRLQRGTKGAVVRNRAKRAFRAAYQKQQQRLAPGYDLLVVLRQPQKEARQGYEQAFLLAAKKLGILA